MWWEPRTDAETVLTVRVFGLLAQYRDELPGGTIVRGVGAGGAAEPMQSGPPLVQVWRPLLLVDGSAFDVPGWRVPYGILRNTDIGGALRSWDLADDVLIEPVGPITPAVTIGAAIDDHNSVQQSGFRL